MKVNVTEQTTTFPYPKSSLKESLIEFIGMEWETSLGNFELTEETLKVDKH